MYFTLLCCSLCMSNVLHLVSSSIASWSESHNVVQFIQLEISGVFSISFLFFYLVSSLFSLVGTTRPRKNYPPAQSLKSFVGHMQKGAILGWWFCQHTLYHLSTHVIVSFSSFPSMLVAFFHVCSSMTL